VVKPAVGTLDLVSKTSQGIKNTTSVSTEPKRQRIRLPRYFGPDRALRVYSEDEAIGQSLLWNAEGGRFAGEWYHFHQELGNGKLIVSNRHIIMTEQERWFAPIKLVRGLQLTGRHIVLLFVKPVTAISMLEQLTNIKLLKPLVAYDVEQLRLVYQQLINSIRVLRQERM